MGDTCLACSNPLPANAAFCPRCGRASGSTLAIRETPQSLLRQLASMVKKHSRRKVVEKFISPIGFTFAAPRTKIKAVQFRTLVMGLFESDCIFRIAPQTGKTLFLNGTWADITLHIFQEAGFDDGKAFAEEYRVLTGRNVQIVKKYA